jgi:hypothetical protein
LFIAPTFWVASGGGADYFTGLGDILDRSSPLRPNTLYYVSFPVHQVAPLSLSVSNDEK